MLILPPVDHVEFRPTKAKPLSGFEPEAAGPARRLFVNGEATAVVVGAGFEVDVRCRDANGRVGGALLWSTLADPMNFIVEGKGFVTEKGDRVRLLPIFANALDGTGRVLGRTESLHIGEENTPGHGWLWNGRQLIDLGIAEAVRFGRAGTLEGYYATDTTGRPVNLFLAREVYLDRGMERYRPLVWWEGVRQEDALLTKPPF